MGRTEHGRLWRVHDGGVATQAKTGRGVLYRRWPNRRDLAAAAIWRQTRRPAADIPDTGTLRADVLAILRHFSAVGGEVAGVASFLLADYFDEPGLPATALQKRARAGEPTAMEIVLDRAVTRGEVHPDCVIPRIALLPVDLVRHELILNRAPAPDKTLIEIVDRIFLPLVLADRPRRGQK